MLRFDDFELGICINNIVLTSPSPTSKHFQSILGHRNFARRKVFATLTMAQVVLIASRTEILRTTQAMTINRTDLGQVRFLSLNPFPSRAQSRRRMKWLLQCVCFDSRRSYALLDLKANNSGPACIRRECANQWTPYVQKCSRLVKSSLSLVGLKANSYYRIIIPLTTTTTTGILSI